MIRTALFLAATAGFASVCAGQATAIPPQTAPGQLPAMPQGIPMKPLGPIRVSGGVIQGLLVKKVPLRYPQDAKRERIQGTVVLHVLINKEGHPYEVSAISGPAKLRDAAVECVQQWEYRPYVLSGEPVDVDTIVTMMFMLSD